MEVENSRTDRLKLGIVACGAILAGSQVLLIRRALAFAGGDEVVFALTLTVWLISVSCGGAMGARLVERIRNADLSFIAGLLLLSIFTLFALPLLHFVSSLTHWVPGTVPGGGGLIVALLVSLFPLGVVGGALFPIGCQALMGADQRAVSLAYLLEAAGSFIAGTAVTLIFAPHIGGLVMAVCFGLLGLAVTLTMGFPRIPTWLLPLVSLVIVIVLQPAIRSFEVSLFSRLRPGLRILDILETPYGLIEVTERQGQIAVHENGLLLAVSDDPAGAEERSHLTLVQHPSPRRVLWIGGSLGGAVQEALRHPSLQRLDLVELNPILFKLGPVLSSDDLSGALQNPRVALHRQDGRRFLSRTAPATYDEIILNLPGPRTARLAKFYTVEAFRLYRRALKPGGVLVFMIETPGDYIGQDLAMLLSSLHETLAKVFDRIVVLPGEMAIFAAGDPTSQLVSDAETLVSRLEQRGIEPLYWDKYRLRDRLSGTRKRILQEAISQRSGIGINRDAAPICFYFQQILWSQQVRGGLPGFLKAVRGVFLPLFLLLIGMGMIVALLLRFLMPGRRSTLGASKAVTAVGLTGISLEILALISYQVHFGSGYREVGLLVGLYMAGLAVGAALSRKIVAGRRKAFRILQTLWVIFPLGLIALSSSAMDFVWLVPVIGGGLFFLYMLLVGMLGGLHFPLAVSYSGADNARRAGIFYSLDLIGSAFGALFIGLLALPLIGISLSVLGLMLVNVIPLVLLLGGNQASA